MIRVTIELLSAITGRTSTIGTMFIANDGNRSSQDPKLGDYIVGVCRRGSEEPPREIYHDGLVDGKRLPKATRTGTVKEYPRLAYNVWRLITRACLATFPEECSPVQNMKRKGVAPTVNEQVMRGLNLMRILARGTSLNGTKEDHDAREAACAWLDAGNSDANGDT